MIRRGGAGGRGRGNSTGDEQTHSDAEPAWILDVVDGQQFFGIDAVALSQLPHCISGLNQIKSPVLLDGWGDDIVEILLEEISRMHTAASVDCDEQRAGQNDSGRQ